MSKLQEILTKRKKEQSFDSSNWRIILAETAKEIVSTMWEEMKPLFIEKAIKEVNTIVQEEIDDLVKNVNKGDKGEKGDFIIGPQGLKGDVGEKGDKGLDGKSGTNGTNGYSPIKNIDYFDGKDGKDGKDGSADKSLEIAKKLNTLEEEVEISVIKGLKDTLKNLQNSIREKRKFGGGGSGGGMGNWITESPSGSINSSNMSFTLTRRVGGGGKAIILLYNGQTQEYTNHFTVSGTTLTMTFAPETGSTLFVMYVRA